jgi:hypothetical protein
MGMQPREREVIRQMTNFPINLIISPALKGFFLKGSGPIETSCIALENSAALIYYAYFPASSHSLNYFQTKVHRAFPQDLQILTVRNY